MVSTSWLKRSNFDEGIEEDEELDPLEAEVRADIAREHALTIMDSEICEYCQWFEGVSNEVADALSRDDDRDDKTLTNIILTFCPEQVPHDFQIVPLPNEIASWLISVLQRLPVKEQLREQHTRSKLGRGSNGVVGGNQSGLGTTCYSTDSRDIKKSNSLGHSQRQCERGDLAGRLMKPWLRAQSEMPSHMWHRPSGNETGEILRSTGTDNLQEFYQGNSGHTETKTHHQNNKKHCQS